MLGLIKSVLIGVLMTLWLTTPGAIAAPTDMRSSVQTYGEDASSALAIAPELTNPAEIPLAEVQPEPISLFTGFDNYALTPAELVEPSASDDSESTMETTLDYWLSLAKRWIENN